MNAIIGFTNIALKQNPKSEVKACLDKISDSSEHLLALINDVLDISRIESGKVQYTPAPVDIAEVSESVLTIMYGYLSNRDITFQTELEEPNTRYVLTDAVRVREVLVIQMNFIGRSRLNPAEEKNTSDTLVLLSRNILNFTLAPKECRGR